MNFPIESSMDWGFPASQRHARHATADVLPSCNATFPAQCGWSALEGSVDAGLALSPGSIQNSKHNL